MHDPDVVVFTIAVPLPKRAKRREGTGPRWTLGRRRYTNAEHLGLVIDAWWQPRAWEPRIAGRALEWAKLCTVWHGEPGGRDSGSVCKGMGGSGLTWANVVWAWHHRRHLEVHFDFARRVKRWRRDRCAGCGKRFRWHDSRNGFMNGDEVYHDVCMSYRAWRSKAEERLTVLELVVDISGLTADDVKAVARLRGDHNDENRAWRVFYDIANAGNTKGIADVGTHG